MGNSQFILQVDCHTFYNGGEISMKVILDQLVGKYKGQENFFLFIFKYIVIENTEKKWAKNITWRSITGNNFIRNNYDRIWWHPYFKVGTSESWYQVSPLQFSWISWDQYAVNV